MYGYFVKIKINGFALQSVHISHQILELIYIVYIYVHLRILLGKKNRGYEHQCIFFRFKMIQLEFVINYI